MDLVTDSKCFCTSIGELLNDPKEKDKVNQLMTWWNRYGLISVVTFLTSLMQASLSSLHGQGADAIPKQCSCEDPAEARRKQREMLMPLYKSMVLLYIHYHSDQCDQSIFMQ